MPIRSKHTVALLSLCAFTLCGAVQAQDTPEPFELKAQGMDGRPYAADTLRGKVAVVFYWSTSCPVCRDSLPELRANLAGWRTKPFKLLTVNVDKKASDWVDYEKVLTQLQVPSNGVITVRQSETTPAPTKLPLTLLVDMQGKIVARYEGRVSPEVWDRVSDLLP